MTADHVAHNAEPGPFVVVGKVGTSECTDHDDGWATQLYFIVCHEGWRESIVCERMYEWAADWLIEQIQGRPYASERARSSLEVPQGRATVKGDTDG